jgi:hypothetical protein
MMRHSPFKLAIAFSALLAMCPLRAATGYFEKPESRAEPKSVHTDPSPCETGQAYTCKLQCGPTTRLPWERWVNNAGVEACVNLGCVCEAQVTPVNIMDPTQPTVFVIFGVRQLLPQAPQ